MAKGLALLKMLDEAQRLRMSAHHMRTMAGPYSVEYDWVQENLEAADQADRDAKHYEDQAQDNH